MKYPYIGELKNGSGGVALFTGDSYGAQLNCKGRNWESKDTNIYGVDNWNEDKFKNITAEYLANTYGEVKSKEHAEFIVKLAEVNGRDNYSVIYLDEAKSFVFDVVGDLKFYKARPSELPSVSHLKQITIPLPPECEEAEENNMVAAKYEKTDRERTLELMHECYHEMSGDFYDFSQKFVDMVALNERESVDEWPKVGDDAILTNENDYGVTHGAEAIGKKVKVMSLFKDDDLDMAAIKHGITNYCFRVDMLKKPKTQEQELRDELIEMTLSHMENKDHPIEANAYYLASEIIEKHIKTKPQ